MSIDFSVPPGSSLSKANDYTSQIHEVLNQHWHSLESKRQATIEKIDDWYRVSEERIKKYADKQKSLINNHYNHLRPSFNEIYEEKLQTANSYHDKQQADLFSKLHDACRSLNFQVTTLKTVKYEMEQPEITLSEEQIDNKSSEALKAARRRRRINNKNKNETENASTGSPRSPSNLVASNSKETDNEKLSKTESKKNKNTQQKSSEDDPKNQMADVYKSNNKCPICFMIFPSSMKRNDCEIHVNEHYADD